MEIISRLSAHAAQYHDVCLIAHGRLPGTLRYVLANPALEQGSGRDGTVLCILVHNRERHQAVQNTSKSPLASLLWRTC